MRDIVYMIESTDSLTINNDNFKMYLVFRENRFMLLDKRIDAIVDTDEELTNINITSEDFLLQMLHLFKHDLDTFETILNNEYLYGKLCDFVNKKNKNWHINKDNVSYLYSRDIKIRVFLNRQKFNKTSVQFIMSNYFYYFENKYLLDIKEDCIKKISYIHNVKPSLVNALLSIRKDFKFNIIETTNIELVSYLEAYRKELYK